MPDHIDEFESLFRRAERELFQYVDIPINSIAVISDSDAAAAEATIKAAKDFMPRLADAKNWRAITGDQYDNVVQLREIVDQTQTDLILTYRYLHEKDFLPQHTLGVYLDVLTQTTSIPVLVLPGSASQPASLSARVCDRVMVVADHITGDNRLINYGARMCRAGGTM